MPPDSFPGCTLDDATSCDDVCALVDRQRARDAPALVDATLVEASCGSGCNCSIRVDDRCATLVLFDEYGSIDEGYVDAETCAP